MQFIVASAALIYLCSIAAAEAVTRTPSSNDTIIGAKAAEDRTTFTSKIYRRQRHRRRPLVDDSGKTANDFDTVINDDEEDASPWTFHLHPTAALEVEDERRRMLLHHESTLSSPMQALNGSATASLSSSLPPDHYQNWFAPEQNAVYATIPDRNDPVHANNRQLREFHSYRHLSRYERQYRISRGLDLQLDWNGEYDGNFFALFEEDEDEENEEKINNNTTELQSNKTAATRHRYIIQNATTARHRRRIIQTGPMVTAGGQFNNYQAVPLSQGYGTHFANVWVGTIPQRKTVIVDTGSHYTAFPCTGCNNCGQAHHTDPYFRPEKSETFKQLDCSECQDGVVCDSGRCTFSQAYTEGSSWEAVQVMDRMYCGGTDVLDSVNPNDQKYAIEFMFGCQISMTGLFITQLADGIMGMSAHPATLPKKLYDAGKIEHNMFAMCFRRELGTSKRGVTAGSMTLGGVSNNLDTSPMVYAKNLAKVGWFTVYVKNIYVRTSGGQSAKSVDPLRHTIKVHVDAKSLNSGKGVIVDSGTTDTYLNKKVAKEFTRAWKLATGQTYSHFPMALTPEQLRSLPTILIQCQAYSLDTDPSIDDYDSIPGYAGRLDPLSPKDLLIAIPATSYMDYSAVTKKYMSRLYFTESAGGVLGSNTMQGHNVLFDWQNGRVGFAESSCAYDKKDVPAVAEDFGFSQDCEVSRPVLSKACIETVDRRMCKLNSTSIALLGKETWTALVQSPGNDAGVSCVEASMDDGVRRKEFDDPIVTCDGQGLCEEERPCQLTCIQAAKAAQVMPLQTANNGLERSCGDSDWSACDYGCMQSRIESTLFTDGLCHEISRISRPCHIGACARDDPCRVPFIVHAVFGFREGAVSKWSQKSEEILASALANTVRLLFGKHLFTVGDVNVVTALPWYQDQDEFDNADTGSNKMKKDYGNDFNAVKLGIKVVVEISMFNPFADDKNRTTQSEDSVNDGVTLGPFSSVLKNITDRMRARKPQATCFQEELYPLATQALKAKEVLQHDAFMKSLVEELKKTGERVDRSTFGPLSSSTYIASENRLLSAWTIRTGIEDEINYFGPQKPFTVRAIAFLQNAALLFVFVFVVMALWSGVLTAHEWYTGRFHNSGFVKPVLRVPYRTVSPVEDHDYVEDCILIGGIELPNRNHKLTVPKKRIRNMDSMDSI